MHINTPKTEEQLLLATRSKGIKLAPLSAYYNGFADSSVLNTYVMNYSSINLNNLDQIAESLYQIVK